MIGQSISHYKILEKLGEGGMGVVYKAHDTKLDRDVALKFLPESVVSSQEEIERFEREAKAISALNHPNIATIYDIDHFDGKRFLVLEYISDGTLKSRLKKLQSENKELSIAEVIELSIQMADGLGHAHRHHIVHRDIKSDNVMLTGEGKIKITDFGLAKLHGATQLTMNGSTIGTPAYMSPEQARGDHVDGRSDIFSFGVVLYELLSGNLPFRGEHHAAILYSLVNEEPSPLIRDNDTIPPGLLRIVSRSLAKDKEDRYQIVEEMLADLKQEQKNLEYLKEGYLQRSPGGVASHERKPRVRFIRNVILLIAGAAAIIAAGLYILLRGIAGEGAVIGPKGKKIAVLPFENLGSANQEYFADGLTDEISTKLSSLSGLSVIAHSSSMHYKKSAKSVKEIGEELGVLYLLEGAVRWEEEDSANHKSARLRVNPRLISVADGTQLWSQSLEGTMAGVFKIQSDIAQQVATALDIALLQPERESVGSKPTENSDAYDYYLRGNEYVSAGFTGENLENGIAMYQKAINADPNFALAYARLGRYQTVMYFLGFDHTQERLQKAKSAIDRAFELHPGLAEAHIAYGYYFKNSTWDLDHAIEQFTLARKTQPNNADLLHGLGICHFFQGRYEEGLSILEHAVEVDPRSADFLNTACLMCTDMRKYDKAQKYSDRLLSLYPEYAPAYFNRIEFYLQSEGKTENARKVLEAMPQKLQAWFTYQWADLDILDRKYDAALHRINAAGRDDTLNYYLETAYIAYLRKQSALQNRLADTARILITKQGEAGLTADLYHYYLSQVYRLLGRKEEAIREFNEGKMITIAQDGFSSGLAEIHMMAGEPESAIALLTEALSVPSNVSAPLLRLDPKWDGLRNNPRFQKLLVENK